MKPVAATMTPQEAAQRLEARKQRNAVWAGTQQRLEALGPDNSYATDLLELARDTDHAGRVDFRSLEEAYQAQYLTRAGIWENPTRGPKGSDFVSNGQMWDLKTETSTPVSHNAGYCSERMQSKIESKLSRGIYLAVDQTYLDTTDRGKLLQLIGQNSDWKGKIVIFERRATSEMMESWKNFLKP